jgi:DNA-binding cell septation regulator SpoVG
LENVKEQVNYVSCDWNFRFDDAKVINGKRVFFIEEIDYNYECGEDKDICIEITDDAEEIAIAKKKEDEERWNSYRNDMTKDIKNNS